MEVDFGTSGRSLDNRRMIQSLLDIVARWKIWWSTIEDAKEEVQTHKTAFHPR
jgi:hypothetical protein